MIRKQLKLRYWVKWKRRVTSSVKSNRERMRRLFLARWILNKLSNWSTGDTQSYLLHHQGPHLQLCFTGSDRCAANNCWPTWLTRFGMALGATLNASNLAATGHRWCGVSKTRRRELVTFLNSTRCFRSSPLTSSLSPKVPSSLALSLSHAAYHFLCATSSPSVLPIMVFISKKNVNTKASES